MSVLENFQTSKQIKDKIQSNFKVYTVTLNIYLKINTKSK